MRMTRKRNLSRKQSLYRTVLSVCMAILLVLQTMTFTAAANQLEEPEFTAPESSVTDAVYGDPGGALIMPLAAPGDKTALILAKNSPFPLEVKQNNTVVYPGGTIEGRQTFTMNSVGIKVPVHADNPAAADSEKILQNDYIFLDQAIYFPKVILTTSGKQDILINGEKIATATFSAAGIRIDFNGLAKFFTQAANISIGFEVTAKGNVTGMGYDDSMDISIFDSDFQLHNPDVTANYNITLSSPGMVQWDQYGYRGIQLKQFVDGAITWQSTVSAFDKDDATIKLPLDGKKFFTDTANNNLDDNNNIRGNVRGVYVPGSFKVNGTVAVPGPNVDADGKLSYTFPPGIGADPNVEYQVWIPKESYYYEYKNPPNNLNRVHRVAFGIVKLLDENDVQLTKIDAQGKTSKVEAGQEISFAPDWIQQTGAVSKQNGIVYATWTIDVNKNYKKQGLKNFIITDALPSGLSYVSSTYQLWDTGKNDWSATKMPISPDVATESIYTFGDIDGPVRLVIVSQVDSGSGSGSKFKNWARANWNLLTPPGGIQQDNDATSGEYPATVSDYAEVTVGAHGLAKSGSFTADDLKIGATTWTVTLTPQYEDSSAAVYDLLIHSRVVNFIDPNKLSDPTGEVAQSVLKALAGDVRGNTGLIGQRYLDGSFSSSDGLKEKAIRLYQDGEYVADVLKVTGYSNKKAAFTFRTLLTDPAQFAGQFSKTSYAAPGWNRAHLFDGDKYANISAQTSVNRHGDMLDKGMLYTSKPLDAQGKPVATVPDWKKNGSVAPIPGDINQYIMSGHNDNYVLSGYDRVSKTATFRLAVNHKGLDTELMKAFGGNRVASDIKLVDTLPEGWEFIPYDESGKLYELYKGYSSNNSDSNYGVGVRTDEEIPSNSPDHVVKFEKSGNQGTFTFSKLEGPYVILLKAKPSNKKLNEYIESGVTTHRVKNNAALSITWGSTKITYDADVNVIVSVDKLSKSVKKVKPGVLEWTVDYTPPFTLSEEVYLQDTLGAGMSLRKDGNGNILLTRPSMAVYRATMNPDGSLKQDGEALNLSDPNSEVKVTATPGSGGTTILKFDFDDPNQIYQLVYQTEIDATIVRPGDKLGNGIKLMGNPEIEAKNLGDNREYTADSSDVQATGSTRALLNLIKKDPDDKPLAGVEFQLFEADGTTPAKDKQGNLIKGTTGADGKIPNFYIDDPGSYVLKQTYIDPVTYLPTTHEYQVYVGNTPWKPIWVDGVEVDTDKPLIVPTPAQGKLTISNKVEGNGGDPSTVFEYIVTFAGEGKDGEYTYKKPDHTLDKIKSGGKILLKHGESIVLAALPAGLVYTVTQTDYTADGYATAPGNLQYSDTIKDKGDHKADFVNKRVVNNLTISNTVTGDGAEPDKPFKYTVTFDGVGKGQAYNYEHSDGTTGTIKSGDTFELKDGENIKINALPDNLKYTITQDGYKNDGYATLPEALTHEGVMAGADRKADFENERTVNKLTVSNTVMGNGGDKTKEFEYTVTFDGTGKDGSYFYVKSDGNTGTIKSGGTFKLKHGETLDILGLPKDLKYTVTQKDYTNEEYVTTPNERHYTGVMKGNDEKASFKNVRLLNGGLLISNTVKGKDDDKKKPFKYTVTFTGKGDNKSYSYEKSDGSKGMIKSGDTFWLTDGQTFVVEGLPTYLKYTVTQDDYTKDGYVTDPEILVHTGTIPEKKAAEAHFVNTRPYLEGVLRDNNTGEVIRNAKIIVTNKQTNEQQTIWTDGKGEYSVPAAADTDYTITYTKMYQVGGKDVPVEFTQKANVDSSVKDETVPADITAVGIVLFKQLDGTTALFDNSVMNDLFIYLKDELGNYIMENGKRKAFPMGPNGTFSVEGLSEQKYTMEVRYKAETGEELLFKVTQLDVKANGELNISEELVDPYGTVYDETTGNAVTGKKIGGATVTLYYANTQRNIDNGRIPGTKVKLPPVPFPFPPNDNMSPEQDSDANGFYAFMVFPEADYYLVVTKDGYEKHTSVTISVDRAIVKYDVPMKPIRSGGGTDTGTSNPPGNNTNPGNENPPTDGNNGPGNGNPPTDGNNGPGNGNPPTDGNNGPGNGNPPTDGNNGPGNGNPPTDGNNGPGNSNPPGGKDARPPEDDELDNVPKTGDTGTSSIFYMALALISLIGLRIAMPFRKKKYN